MMCDKTGDSSGMGSGSMGMSGGEIGDMDLMVCQVWLIEFKDLRLMTEIKLLLPGN
jgi:hypothetical protein